MIVHTNGVTVKAEELFLKFPPRWNNKNKEYVCGKAAQTPTGTIRICQWEALSLPAFLPDIKEMSESLQTDRVSVVPGPFDYSSPGEWYLNFADPMVFGFYSGGLLAQDELQVLEHPILGSVREMLDVLGWGEAVNDEGECTPITLTGVQRNFNLDTTDLYGNKFNKAPRYLIDQSLQILDPPTVSNILAVAALVGYEGGYYSEDQIRHILTTAYTGFSACKIHMLKPQTVVHTGFWGCGAFGGNKILMSILQLLVADLAGVKLVFHTMNDLESVQEARWVYHTLSSISSDVNEFIGNLLDRKFQWGTSDGN